MAVQLCRRARRGAPPYGPRGCARFLLAYSVGKLAALSSADIMSMIDIDPPGFQPPRPVAGDDGNRRTVLYGGYTVFSVFQPVFSVSHRRAIGYHASLRAHGE